MQRITRIGFFFLTNIVCLFDKKLWAVYLNNVLYVIFLDKKRI